MLQEGHVGIQCEHSLRSLLFLLDGWGKHTGTRKKLYGKNDNGTLTIIYFDKFALLLFRLWDTMFQRQGNNKAQRQEQEADKFTFRSPFEPIPGKHGSGPGRFNESGKDPAYLADMLYELQSEDILQYFQVVPPPDAPGDPKNYQTIVLPAIPVTDTRDFLHGFNALEQEALYDLNHVLKQLGPSEIRALGTHSTREGTIADIEREFKYLRRHKQATIDGLKNGQSFVKSSQELMEFADEAWRKSKGNRSDYHDGYVKMLNEIRNDALLEAFKFSQNSPDVIWDTSTRITELTLKSEQARAFTKYLRAIAFYRDHIDQREGRASREAKKFAHYWTEGLSEMQRCSLSGFPTSIQEIFVDNTSEIRQEVRNHLIEVLEKF